MLKVFPSPDPEAPLASSRVVWFLLTLAVAILFAVVSGWASSLSHDRDEIRTRVEHLESQFAAIQATQAIEIQHLDEILKHQK